jgi:hypothetical protein
MRRSTRCRRARRSTDLPIPRQRAADAVAVTARDASVLDHPALRRWLAVARLSAHVTVAEGKLFVRDDAAPIARGTASGRSCAVCSTAGKATK